MAKRIFVVTATDVSGEDSNAISFSFMFRAKIPPDILKQMAILGRYGTFKKSGESGNERWVIVSGNAQSGPIFACGFSVSPEEKSISDLKVALSQMADTVLLVKKEYFPMLETACKELGIELMSHHFDGALQAS